MSEEAKHWIKIGAGLAGVFVLICLLLTFLFRDKSEVVLNTYTIEAGSRTSLSSLVSRINGVEIKESNRVSDNTIHLKDMDVILSGIDTNKLGEQELVCTFSSDTEKVVRKKINIVDTISPEILWLVEMNEEIELNVLEEPSNLFTVKDSFNSYKDIQVEMETDKENYRDGDTLILTVCAVDTSGNSIESSLQLKVKKEEEKSKEEGVSKEPSKEPSKVENPSQGNNGGASSPNGGNPTNVIPSAPQQTVPSNPVPACSFRTFYASSYGDNLISAYNAAQDYYDSCSGSASMYPINDSDGNTIGWGVR